MSGGICPRKAGRGAEGLALRRADAVGLSAAYVSRAGSCIWAGGKKKRENEEQMEELDCK